MYIFFRVSAVAQEAVKQISILPEETSAMTAKQEEEQFLPISQNILDEAILAHQDAEQFLVTAQTSLDYAALTEQEAEQKLANAQAELELATAQQQAAEQAVRQEEEQLAAELARREAELATAEVQKQETDQQLSISIAARGFLPFYSFLSLFLGLKVELIHGKTYNTRQEAKTAIFEYIEVFYNRQRRHSYLGYLSPDEYEKKNVA